MRIALAAALLTLPAPVLAQEARPEPATPASVVAAATPSEWKAIDRADLLVMDLAPDPAGNERRVVIQLIPAPFSQGWVGNIRKLAQGHWWDGTSVYRVVDNWVSQWGDVEETKPMPAGVTDQPDDTYTAPAFAAPELTLSDSYAKGAGFDGGWPVGFAESAIWPLHCYGAVGVARSVGSGGTGSELYAVIGHAPRQLDRNIAVVGRVIEGIEHLSTLPRGPSATNGVYDDAAQRTPILSARLANDMADGAPLRFEYLDSASDSFKRYVEVRANRKDPFYLHPAGGIDVCNVQPPVRRMPAG
ncbi:peptidylprolyl isomerase [Tsuneonella sp. HG222]